MNGLLYRDYFLEKSMQHSQPVIQPDRQTDCLPVFLPAPWDKITSYIHSFTLEITIHSFCVWIYLYTYIPLGLLCVVLYSHPNETIPCPIYQPTNELWKKLTFEIWFFGLACIGVWFRKLSNIDNKTKFTNWIFTNYNWFFQPSLLDWHHWDKSHKNNREFLTRNNLFF